MSRPDKFTGTFFDIVASIFEMLDAHENHMLFYSLIDLDFGEVRCTSCRTVVVSGSRELIESCWIEFQSSDSSFH